MSNNLRQSGFSLIELLIALIVFSIGLLAVAGLQTVSKQSNFEALQRTSGSQIAYGLLEDMRINGDAMNIYLEAGELGPVSDAQAVEWLEANALMWAVVIKPWI